MNPEMWLKGEVCSWCRLYFSSSLFGCLLVSSVSMCPDRCFSALLVASGGGLGFAPCPVPPTVHQGWSLQPIECRSEGVACHFQHEVIKAWLMT